MNVGKVAGTAQILPPDRFQYQKVREDPDKGKLQRRRNAEIWYDRKQQKYSFSAPLRLRVNVFTVSTAARKKMALVRGPSSRKC